MPIEEISRLVGHVGTHVTELVYRHQLRPVIERGAVAMERLFASDAVGGESAWSSPRLLSWLLTLAFRML